MSLPARCVTHTHPPLLPAPPSHASPLFEQMGEKAGAEGGDPHILFPADGVAELGAVFTTQHPTESESIWTMPVYDSANFHLTYLRVTPGSRVGQIDIQCQEAPGGTTDASVTYTFTALSEQGNAFTARFSEAHYQAMMADWERAINFYLAHGHTLPHH